MGNRRVYEIARDRGLTTAELLERPERELLSLERQASADAVGGVCPSCGLHTKQTRYCLRCGAALPSRHKEISPLSPVAVLVAIALIATAWFVGGSTFGSESGSSSSSNGGGTSDLGPQQNAASTAAQYKSIVATVKGPKIQVYSKPRSDKPLELLDSPNLDGAK